MLVAPIPENAKEISEMDEYLHRRGLLLPVEERRWVVCGRPACLHRAWGLVMDSVPLKVCSRKADLYHPWECRHRHGTVLDRKKLCRHHRRTVLDRKKVCHHHRHRMGLDQRRVCHHPGNWSRRAIKCSFVCRLNFVSVADAVDGVDQFLTG